MQLSSCTLWPQFKDQGLSPGKAELSRVRFTLKTHVILCFKSGNGTRLEKRIEASRKCYNIVEEERMVATGHISSLFTPGTIHSSWETHFWFCLSVSTFSPYLIYCGMLQSTCWQQCHENLRSKRRVSSPHRNERNSGHDWQILTQQQYSFVTHFQDSGRGKNYCWKSLDYQTTHAQCASYYL